MNKSFTFFFFGNRKITKVQAHKGVALTGGSRKEMGCVCVFDGS